MWCHPIGFHYGSPGCFAGSVFRTFRTSAIIILFVLNSVCFLDHRHPRRRPTRGIMGPIATPCPTKVQDPNHSSRHSESNRWHCDYWPHAGGPGEVLFTLSLVAFARVLGHNHQPHWFWDTATSAKPTQPPITFEM